MELPVQLILVLSILSLTAVFVIIGIWIILILRELRLSFKKVNSTLSSVETAVKAIGEPIASVSEIWQGAKRGIKFLNSIFKENSKNSGEPPQEKTEPTRVKPAKKPKFFLKRKAV